MAPNARDVVAMITVTRGTVSDSIQRTSFGTRLSRVLYLACWTALAGDSDCEYREGAGCNLELGYWQCRSSPDCHVENQLRDLEDSASLDKPVYLAFILDAPLFEN